MNLDNYEIMIYLSDQHAADVVGFMGDPVVRTPNLDRLAKAGCVFRNAYTPCPLCVPARAAMMTGRMPSELGVFGNDDAYCSQHGTFAHAFGAAGYETVLCGRMHFVGEEQRHGFEKRIARDFSPSLWGNPSESRPAMGDFGRSLYQKWCLEVIGEGDSPVRAYDRYVTEEAVTYLKNPHERPQMMVVGTYAPHFPYVGSPEKMEYYRKRVMDTFHNKGKSFAMDAVEGKHQYTTEHNLIELRSAYYAMIEEMDEQIGLVYGAWREYLAKKGAKGIFVYLSDHGDQIGEKAIYGKQTFFEYSAKIPMVIQIDGVEPPDVRQPSSLLDLGSTLCGLAGISAPPLSEGADWSLWLKENVPVERNAVYSEYFDTVDGRDTIGIMIREKQFKYISYSGFEKQDAMFDLESDPYERRNLAGESPEADKFKILARGQQERREQYLRIRREKKDDSLFLAKWGAYFREEDDTLWTPPESVRKLQASTAE